MIFEQGTGLRLHPLGVHWRLGRLSLQGRRDEQAGHQRHGGHEVLLRLREPEVEPADGIQRTWIAYRQVN